MDPETEDATPGTEAEVPLDERMSAFVEKEVLAATESEPAEETPEEDEESPAEESPADETPAKVEVSAEQLKDSKYWGSLDKAGWERMERDYPVETKHVKAAQAAATSIVNEARKAPTKTAGEEHQSAKSDDEPSEEWLAAHEQSQSLDPKEAAIGARKMLQITQREERERERAAEAAASERTQGIIASAYGIAVKAVPELAKLSEDDLDAAVRSDADLTADLAIANSLTDDDQRIRMTSRIMKDAARIVLAKQAAADETAKKTKKAEDGKRARSGEAAPSTVLGESTTGNEPGKVRSFERDGPAFVEQRLAEEMRAAGAKR